MAPAAPHCLDPFEGGRARTRPPRVRRKPLAVACVAALLLLVLFGASAWLRAAAEPTRADIVFVVDATGSMGDEIHDVKSNIMGIGNKLANRKPQPDVRFGAVFYRDQGDKELVRTVPLSHDLGAVRGAIMDVEADGGGDWKEHVGVGLHKALEMDWSHSGRRGVRLVYLVADAPYHTYDDGYDVPSALELARKMGVKVHVIGCSGLGSGTPAMRGIAAETGGTFSELVREQGGQHRPSPRRRSGDPLDGPVPTAKAVSSAPREKAITGPVIGVDVGASRSCVGVWKNGHGVQIIPNDRGDRTTPSDIAFVDGEWVVGEAAREHAARNTSQSFSGLKHLIGRRFHDSGLQDDLKWLPLSVGEKDGMPVLNVTKTGATTTMTPEQGLSLVIAEMREAAEAYLGQRVAHAIVTVPASFGDAQRQATKDAGRMAGVDVLRIINEPTAAAIAYSLDKRNEQNILVYHLGGMTMDVSVLTIDNGVFELVTTSGQVHLGGDDFDRRVLHHYIERINRSHGVDMSGRPGPVQKLLREVNRAKRELSWTHTAKVEVEGLLGGVDDFSATLTRARFEELNKDLFLRTLDPVRQVLNISGLAATQVDEIVLVGGSTKIPKIQQLVKEYFHGKEPIRGIANDEVVATGAAIQASILSGEGGTDLLLLDVTPLTLGIEAARGVMTAVVPRNSVIPTRRSVMLTTQRADQDTVAVRVFEGERPLVADNRRLAEINVSGIPPAPAGVPRIEVTLEVDSDGVLHVVAEDRGTGSRQRVAVASDEGRLAEEQIEQMIEDAEAFAEGDRRSVALLEGGIAETNASGVGATLGVSLGLTSEDAGAGRAELGAAEDEGEGSGLGKLSAMMLHSIYDEL